MWTDVMPAQAGIQYYLFLDSRLRTLKGIYDGNDELGAGKLLRR